MELDPKSYQDAIAAQEKAIRQIADDFKKREGKKVNNDDGSAHMKDNISKPHSARGQNEGSFENDSHNEEEEKVGVDEPGKKNQKVPKRKVPKKNLEVISAQEGVSAKPEELEIEKTEKGATEV